MGTNSLYGPLDPAPDAGYADPPPRMGFFTDTSICIGCKACEVACKEWNGVPDDGLNLLGMSYDNTGGLSANTWRHVAFIEQPRADREEPGDVRWLMMSDVCKHCTHAACLDVCPTGALFRTELGTVVVQQDICNGCGYCIPACPYGVIDQREGDGRAWKCTLCYDRIGDGLMPACATACPTESIQYGPLDELRERAQRSILDGLGRARRGAGRHQPVTDPVVAQRALPRPPVALTLVDDAVRARRNAVPATVADVLLHHDRAKLGAKQRPGRADVQARRVGTVLADIGHHEPAHVAGLLAIGARLLYEGDMAPGVRAQPTGVVVGHAEQVQPVVGYAVPLLARDLARLAADADAGVGEEPHPWRRVGVPGVGRRIERTLEAVRSHGSRTALVVGFEAGPPPVLPQVRQQRRPGRAPPRLDIARTDLALLDQHVGVEHDPEQVVGG